MSPAITFDEPMAPGTADAIAIHPEVACVLAPDPALVTWTCPLSGLVPRTRYIVVLDSRAHDAVGNPLTTGE